MCPVEMFTWSNGTKKSLCAWFLHVESIGYHGSRVPPRRRPLELCAFSSSVRSTDSGGRKMWRLFTYRSRAVPCRLCAAGDRNETSATHGYSAAQRCPVWQGCQRRIRPRLSVAGLNRADPESHTRIVHFLLWKEEEEKVWRGQAKLVCSSKNRNSRPWCSNRIIFLSYINK